MIARRGVVFLEAPSRISIKSDWIGYPAPFQ